MKTLILTYTAFFSLISLSFAGTEQPVEKQLEQSSNYKPWFADSEWNIGLAGDYAFPESEFRTDAKRIAPNPLKIGYLNADHAWGGSLEAKYFFHRYFGLGVVADILAPNALVVDEEGSAGAPRILTHRDRRTVGSVLGSFTLRYPIGTSRFAPFAYAAGGAIFGGGTESILRRIGGMNVQSVFTEQTDGRTEALAQFGGGIEFRLTPHIGLTSDFSWNIVNGPKNNFGLVRSGINFAF